MWWWFFFSFFTDPPGPPEILGYIEGETVRTGQEVNLVCVSRGGNPLAQIVWYKNDVKVDFSFVTSGRESRNTLSFKAQSSDNNARFRCEASNQLSTAPMKAEITLTVHCKSSILFDSLLIFCWLFFPHFPLVSFYSLSPSLLGLSLVIWFLVVPLSFFETTNGAAPSISISAASIDPRVAFLVLHLGRDPSDWVGGRDSVLKSSSMRSNSEQLVKKKRGIYRIVYALRWQWYPSRVFLLYGSEKNTITLVPHKSIDMKKRLAWLNVVAVVVDGGGIGACSGVGLQVSTEILMTPIVPLSTTDKSTRRVNGLATSVWDSRKWISFEKNWTQEIFIIQNSRSKDGEDRGSERSQGERHHIARVYHIEQQSGGTDFLGTRWSTHQRERITDNDISRRRMGLFVQLNDNRAVSRAQFDRFVLCCCPWFGSNNGRYSHHQCYM